MTALAPSFYLMLIFIFIAGLGFGTVNPATSKGIIEWFSARWRATAMAIKQMGFTAGTMVVAAVLPAIAVVVGWRWAVILVAGLTILIGIISLFVYPLSVTKRIGPADERPVSAPTAPEESVWKNKQIIFWSVICIFYAVVQTSGTVYLAVYMVDYFSYSKIMAGMFLAITQGGGALGRVAWGRISDTYFAENRDKELVTIGFIAAAMCIILGLLPVSTHCIIVGTIAAIFGFTAIGYSAVFLTFIGEMARSESAGQAIGLSITICYWGIVLGPPAFGLTIDIMGYQKAWIALGCMLAMVIIFTILFTQRRINTSYHEGLV